MNWIISLCELGSIYAPTILRKNSETASIFCPFPRQSNVVGVLGGLFGVKMFIWKQHCFVGGGA